MYHVGDEVACIITSLISCKLVAAYTFTQNISNVSSQETIGLEDAFESFNSG